MDWLGLPRECRPNVGPKSSVEPIFRRTTHQNCDRTARSGGTVVARGGVDSGLGAFVQSGFLPSPRNESRAQSDDPQLGSRLQRFWPRRRLGPNGVSTHATEDDTLLAFGSETD